MITRSQIAAKCVYFLLYRSRGRNILHMACHTAPDTLDHLFSRLGVATQSTVGVLGSLLNQPDHYNEDNQWLVFYYADNGFVAGMADRYMKWAVVKNDRNRMAYSWAMSQGLQDLEVTMKLEGEGDELDAGSLQELDRAKAGYRSLDPDRSPLHYAAEEGNVHIAKWLVNKGADVNQKDAFGMTPLHTACKHGNKDIVKLLCNSAADLFLLDKTNFTPMQVGEDNGHLDVECMLLNRQIVMVRLALIVIRNAVTLEGISCVYLLIRLLYTAVRLLQTMLQNPRVP